MDKRRSRLASVLVAAVLSSLLAACGSSSPSTASDKPYVPPEASDTPTLDPRAERIPDGPLFLPLRKWLPSPTSEKQLNPCLDQPFVVLGADKIRYRSFHASTGDAQAQDVVAVFHDPYAARQAAYLLRRWQETCASRLVDSPVTADPPRSVAAGQGSELWFTTYQAGTTGAYARSATGLVQVGRFIGLVTIHDTATNTDPANVQATLVRMVGRGYSRLS
jgi:hypothetical protein